MNPASYTTIQVSCIWLLIYWSEEARWNARPYHTRFTPYRQTFNTHTFRGSGRTSFGILIFNNPCFLICTLNSFANVSRLSEEPILRQIRFPFFVAALLLAIDLRYRLCFPFSSPNPGVAALLLCCTSSPSGLDWLDKSNLPPLADPGVGNPQI